MAAPPSKLRKFIGILKDEASLSMAKFGSSLDPDLEILIIKATSHNDDIPSPKYMDEILHKASTSGEFAKACLSLISNRIEKTHDWIVGLKSLLVVHKLMVAGGRIFLEEIAHVGMLRKLHDFWDELHSDSSGYCDFVRRYGMYLSWKVDSMVFDKMWLGKKVILNNDEDDRLSGFEGSKNFNEMDTERVLIHMEQLQTMLGRVLDCFPRTKRKHHKIVLRALSPVVEESFGLYKEICDGLSVLVDRFWAMDYQKSSQSYGIYVTVAKQIDELVGFYAWCEGGGIARPAEYTHIERVSDDLLRSFEELLISKGKSAKSSSAVDPSTIWDECSDLCEATSASETPAADPACIIDSELALVESESNLAAKPAAELGGSFDSLVVDDQGSFGSASSDPLPGLESEESSVHALVDEDPVEEKRQTNTQKQLWQQPGVNGSGQTTRKNLKEGTSFF